ncbi:MAG: YifB family Mg chelatase-like AAA ATPase [Coriobacteriia bacterium]|nr:YifB family Mg chelatase-like AAA ATPase [Coriobacteriia bacterium]MCL2537358.1 YifB family Mg chelatase-like AAA ATPase [Coriobacteriia bacterium]
MLAAKSAQYHYKSRRYSEVLSAGMHGVEPKAVSVQVHLTTGLTAFHIVGLGDQAVKESHRRVCAALKNSGFRVPDGVITVNLAPALMNKSGTGYDLAIALGILMADAELDAAHFKNHLVVGELGLDGSVSPVRGMVGYGILAAQSEQTLVCSDAALYDQLIDLKVVEIKHLSQLHYLEDLQARRTQALDDTTLAPPISACGDYADVVGQQQAVRALSIAAAGQHNVFMVGPPGTGKTMLASRLPSILPPMDSTQLVESALVFSVAGAAFDHSSRQRPFRAPHHSATMPALVGGGMPVRPGEVSLAHNGVLFLDEMPQFSRTTLQALRQPIEEGRVRLVRAQGSFEFPSNFMMVGAANPCPCGYYGDQATNCRCLPHQIEQYQNRVGGPLLDRFDLFITVPRPNPDFFFKKAAAQTQSVTSAELYQQVSKARAFAQKAGRPSVHGLSRQQLCATELIEPAAVNLLRRAAHNLQLSGRMIVASLRLARTIADLDQSKRVTATHLSEALSYRKTWNHV